MDPVRNPFVPGAGSQPPELAGRSAIIDEANIALQRVIQRRPSQSQILLGLRGVGKTVLLNKIRRNAESYGHLVSFIEAPEGKSLSELLYPKLYKVLLDLSLAEKARAKAHRAMRALAGFVRMIKVSIGEVAISVDPEPGVADSGNLEYDLSDLLVRVGEAVADAGRAWTLLIDEIQYLTESDLAALIVALHRASQDNLPILFFGAGLPQAAGLTGEAKSYSERLFTFPQVGPLDKAAANSAIRHPIEQEGEKIDDDALDEIFDQTKGYPYFLQEWAYQAWNLADHSPIARSDIIAASNAALKRLDDGFFTVRMDRLTPRERGYVIAMAQLGRGPYRSADVAARLGQPIQTLGPLRASIIKKGVIYSPAHGDIDFTVPMFDEYLHRKWRV